MIEQITYTKWIELGRGQIGGLVEIEAVIAAREDGRFRGDIYVQRLDDADPSLLSPIIWCENESADIVRNRCAALAERIFDVPDAWKRA